MPPSARILVVDDQQDNIDLLRLMLAAKDYTVDVAYDGASALTRVRQTLPDLILLDVMMPELDGLETTARIRNDPTLPFIPIILVTAQYGVDSKVDGLEAGADDFLSKPVDCRELLAKVGALLRLKRAQDALLEERNKTSLLFRIQQQLTNSLEIDEVVKQSICLMVEAVNADHGSLIVFDNQGKEWRRTLLAHGATPVQTKVLTTDLPDQDLTGLAMQMRAPQLFQDTWLDLDWAPLSHEPDDVRSATVLPLQHASGMLGVLTLTHPEPHHFSGAQFDLLQAAASQISTALHNASLYGLLRESERSREQFVHMLTHDLRNPLTGIAGCLRVLEQQVRDPKAHPFIAMAQQACQTQEQLIADILDVYKAEAGHMSLFREPINLDQLGDEVTANLQGAAVDRGIDLIIDLPHSPQVHADHDKLLRVLLNLVGNAIKFTRTGAVCLTAMVRDNEMYGVVRDTGDGMPLDQLEKIFDRFYQSDQHGARRGTGLGLTFCREVIHAHGGRIWASSTLGVGTILSFTLPLHSEVV